jgi:class 3 adenylate cyclase
VVRGIQLGAEDYLPKPFEPILLQARIATGLDKKKRRDLELEYLRQVEQLTTAAEAVQGSIYEAETISSVASRADALGNLARVFQKMAQEVVAREQRLKQQLRQLQIDIEERQSAASDTAAIYIPMDRRQALARGETLPERTQGTALFADISGFTPLTESFARELGLQRGAEEVTRQVNQVLSALIENVHRFGGSVIGFSGDAILCWFDGDDGLKAAACALALQDSMRPFAAVMVPGGKTVSIGVKVSLTAGPARRLLVGNPKLQRIDVLAGRTFDELAQAEQQAKRGEIVAPAALVEAFGDGLIVSDWREGKRFAVISGVTRAVAASPWPEIPEHALGNDQVQPWLPPSVFEKVQNGQSAFLSELRPASPLFLKFSGIDYDNDPEAQTKLDAFMRWVQQVIYEHDGAILQLTTGDKGSYFYIAFGAPIAHYDDATRAVSAALKLQTPPPEFTFISDVRIGVTYGQTRAGAYGSPLQRTYGVMGDKTNLAARLMMAAEPNSVLCDESVYEAAHDRIHFEALPAIVVKGKSQPVAVYRPLHESSGVETESAGVVGRAVERALLIDRLSPTDQLTLKTASVIGRVFSFEMLSAIYPDDDERLRLDDYLETLVDMNLIAPNSGGSERSYSFIDTVTQETAYSLMLFAQRRGLHRAAAEWYERVYAADLSPHYASLGRHWRAADEPARAIAYFEKAGERARQAGNYEEAQHYLNESLALDAKASVLSANYE